MENIEFWGFSLEDSNSLGCIKGWGWNHMESSAFTHLIVMAWRAGFPVIGSPPVASWCYCASFSVVTGSKKECVLRGMSGEQVSPENQLEDAEPFWTRLRCYMKSLSSCSFGCRLFTQSNLDSKERGNRFHLGTDRRAHRWGILLLLPLFNAIHLDSAWHTLSDQKYLAIFVEDAIILLQRILVSNFAFVGLAMGSEFSEQPEFSTWDSDSWNWLSIMIWLNECEWFDDWAGSVSWSYFWVLDLHCCLTFFSGMSHMCLART